MNEYVVSAFKKAGFHCPYCNVWAHQKWFSLFSYSREEFKPLWCSVCQKCGKHAVWWGNKILHPSASSAPLPSDDMPKNVKEDFEEARSVLNASSRAATALLRLALQNLMVKIGEKGKNLNDDIGNLVKKGLPEKIQKALDSVRVIGNNAVHPGQIDLKDDPETATVLFDLLNMIVDFRISQEKKINAMFNKLPKEAKEQIKKRNGTP